MTPIQSLLQERADLDAKIAAQKPLAVGQVLALMAELGVTREEVGAAKASKVSTLPVKYRDDKGNTWTGVGQRPRWLKARLELGASLDQFKV